MESVHPNKGRVREQAASPVRLLENRGAHTTGPPVRHFADPFHVVRLSNTALDEVCRRVHNRMLEHRGPQHDPCIGPAGRSSRRLKASPTLAGSSCGACSTRATPTARSVTLGTPKRPSAEYYRTTVIGTLRLAASTSERTAPSLMSPSLLTRPDMPKETNTRERIDVAAITP